MGLSPAARTFWNMCPNVEDVHLNLQQLPWDDVW